MSSNAIPAVSVIKARMQTLNKEIDKLKDEITIRDKIIKDEADQKAEIALELVQLTKKIENVETEKNSFELKFKEACEILELISKDAQKSERNRKILENRQNADIDRIDQLEQNIKLSSISTEEANKRYEELLKKVSVSEHLLEKAETRSSNGDNRIKQLESDLKTIVTKLKVLENQNDKVADREIHYDNGIRCLTMQVKEAEDRALSAEREVIRREQEINSLKEEVEREKTNYYYIKNELDKLHDGYFGL